jgi:hypothetical protein
MARDDLPIKVPLDYPTIKQLEKQAEHAGINRGARMRTLLRAALALQQMLPHPAVLDALAELHSPDPKNPPDPQRVQSMRRLLQGELAGN